VTWTGSPNQNLEYVAPSLWAAEWVPDSDGNPITGIPQIFTIEGTNLRIKPSDTTALTFDYFQKTAALSGTLNWLYTNYPDAYLFGTLCEMNAFNKGRRVRGGKPVEATPRRGIPGDIDGGLQRARRHGGACHRDTRPDAVNAVGALDA
jgi:hypothetical protein